MVTGLWQTSVLSWRGFPQHGEAGHRPVPPWRWLGGPGGPTVEGTSSPVGTTTPARRRTRGAT